MERRNLTEETWYFFHHKKCENAEKATQVLTSPHLTSPHLTSPQTQVLTSFAKSVVTFPFAVETICLPCFCLSGFIFVLYWGQFFRKYSWKTSYFQSLTLNLLLIRFYALLSAHCKPLSDFQITIIPEWWRLTPGSVIHHQFRGPAWHSLAREWNVKSCVLQLLIHFLFVKTTSYKKDIRNPG